MESIPTPLNTLPSELIDIQVTQESPLHLGKYRGLSIISKDISGQITYCN